MKIVVVEDEAPIRNGMSRLLDKINPEYELAGTAENGLQGLELIEKVKPDLIIMDIHMPDMDGLTMLAKVREKGMNCKAIVLSAYSDFSYAKIAIELGIENYLLKPIKIPELKRALEQVEKTLIEQQSKEEFFTLENIFYRSATGQFKSDRQTDITLEERFRIAPDEEISILLVKLSGCYAVYHDTVRSLLEETGIHKGTFSSCVVEIEERESVIMLLYKAEDKEELRQYFQKAVMPMLCGQVKGSITAVWQSCEGLAEVNPSLAKMREALEWNLVFGRETLISETRIGQTEPVPIKYPVDIETQARQAIVSNNKAEFDACTKRLKEYFLSVVHAPKEIKEACTRYCMSVYHTAKEAGKVSEDISTQDIMNKITLAYTWEQIGEAYHQFFEGLRFHREEEATSLMVQRAAQLIQEYYNQGITLEEIARKLCVSEEYLSAQFKKETGRTFTETIRGYRIEKVKELLLQTTLKLNQIADLAGYTDPKYMSKVFRDEVGVTPAEYRKLNN
ncbi:response regulator transcription factor [Extibacter muris]|uniref:response regulator transcription factor n=1 Tax=Extibacter muris TaxID=1796622 RepID=UPI001D095C46|nr:response regulator [Extibacter muris]MCB6203696.1 response regulator [Extibacter muris]MCQ4665250.1 response regulator [Extibacter muris]MCQ4694745.1 response regulator [Extibacter muris]